MGAVTLLLTLMLILMLTLILTLGIIVNGPVSIALYPYKTLTLTLDAPLNVNRPLMFCLIPQYHAVDASMQIHK